MGYKPHSPKGRSCCNKPQTNTGIGRIPGQIEPCCSSIGGRSRSNRQKFAKCKGLEGPRFAACSFLFPFLFSSVSFQTASGGLPLLGAWLLEAPTHFGTARAQCRGLSWRGDQHADGSYPLAAPAPFLLSDSSQLFLAALGGNEPSVTNEAKLVFNSFVKHKWLPLNCHGF